MRNLEKGQHIFIAFQNGEAVLDSQLRPRMYTSLENADRWTPTVNKGKIEYVEYAPTIQAPNEPLTLEQLREMDGEPVWVQNLEEPEKSQWRLLHWDRGKYLVLQGISVRGYLLEEYGESWLAYRRPPEGEEEHNG